MYALERNRSRLPRTGFPARGGRLHLGDGGVIDPLIERLLDELAWQHTQDGRSDLHTIIDEAMRWHRLESTAHQYHGGQHTAGDLLRTASSATVLSKSATILAASCASFQRPGSGRRVCLIRS